MTTVSGTARMTRQWQGTSSRLTRCSLQLHSQEVMTMSDVLIPPIGSVWVCKFADKCHHVKVVAYYTGTVSIRISYEVVARTNDFQGPDDGELSAEGFH